MKQDLKELSIAVVGCGRMGRTRAERIGQLGGKVAFAIDPDPEAAAELGAERVAQVEELNPDHVDAVFLCTPPDARSSHVLELLSSGVPVFFEKPLARNAAEAEAWVRACPEGTVTGVGYQNRSRRSVIDACAAAREEGLVALVGHWACGQYARDWWKDPARSGGPLNEQMTHLVDLARAAAGEIEQVSALGAAAEQAPGSATDAAVAVRFESGVVGTLAYSCRASAKGIGLRLVTPSATHLLEGWDFRGPQSSGDEDPFVTETETFLRAVLDPAAPRPAVSVHEALRTQLAVDAIARSMAENRPSRPAASVAFR